MINPEIARLRPGIEQLLVATNKINQLKNNKYWYPLNVATYGSEEILEAVDSMCAYQTSMFDKTRTFEREFGNKFGLHAVMVNSGSSADLLITYALNKNSGGPLNPGDEILLPAVTWPTQLWSIIMAQFKAKLIDVDRDTLNISIESLEASISKKTKALFITHLMGNMTNMDEVIRICDKNGLLLIEDSCEALGSRWNQKLAGTFGLAASFSFFFSHHITTMEGGMILTPDAQLADKFRVLRSHGWSREQVGSKTEAPHNIDMRYNFIDWGFNLRPTELQAGFGSVQLTKLDTFNYWRRMNASLLIEKLSEFRRYFRVMRIDEKVDCSWFALPIILRADGLIKKETLTNHLESNGVETRPIVAGNLINQPALSKFTSEISAASSLQGAEFIHKYGFYIGIRPFEDKEEIIRIFNIFSSFFKKYHRYS